jgi:hypothetical protein
MLRQGDRPATVRCNPQFKIVSSGRATRQVDQVPHTEAFAISRNLARVAAKKRPSNRPPPSFSIRTCQLWALQFSHSKIPVSSGKIEAFPWRKSRPLYSTKSTIATLLNRPSKKAHRTPSRRLASLDSCSFRHCMNQLRLSSRSRAVATDWESVSCH